MRRDVLFWVSLCVALALVAACGKDSTGPSGPTNEMTVGGNSYDLANLYFLNYGRNAAGAFNIDVNLTSSGLTFNSSGIEGNGEAVVLELFFPGDAVSVGTYSYTDDSWDSAPALTFTGNSKIWVGYNAYTGNAAETHLITGGSVDISTSGVNYTIEGTFTVAGGGSASVDFTGPLSGSF